MRFTKKQLRGFELLINSKKCPFCGKKHEITATKIPNGTVLIESKNSVCCREFIEQAEQSARLLLHPSKKAWMELIASAPLNEGTDEE